MQTEIGEVFSELGKGVFQPELSKGLNEMVEKVLEHGEFGKQGELIIKLKFTPAKENQIVLSSTLSKKLPTDSGHKTETFSHETGFHIDGNGKMVGFVPESNPEGQGNMEV